MKHASVQFGDIYRIRYQKVGDPRLVRQLPENVQNWVDNQLTLRLYQEDLSAKVVQNPLQRKLFGLMEGQYLITDGPKEKTRTKYTDIEESKMGLYGKLRSPWWGMLSLLSSFQRGLMTGFFMRRPKEIVLQYKEEMVTPEAHGEPFPWYTWSNPEVLDTLLIDKLPLKKNS